MRSEARISAAAGFAIALLVQFACVPLAAIPALAAAAALKAENAWIRWLPADLPAAGYLRLINAGDAAATLTGAESPAYAHVSLHRTVDVGGRVQMRPVERITIAAHSNLDFEASGYHMMLMDATQPLKPADHVPITLHFADGTSLLVQFEVRKPDAS